MSSEDEIEELKRIIAEEQKQAEITKQQRLEKMRVYKRKHRAERDADPERYARFRETENNWRKKTKATTSHLRRRRERLAGRPKPETCEVCGRGGPIVFEHSHKTKAFRGWTCTRCNVALGMVNDDIVVLEKLIVYLKAHSDE
jgi:DNA gyrase/topoisomerase IV subunit A